MRSRGQTFRPAWLLSLVLLASMGLSGCQVSRSFFQMDSNSRVPFMGVDLLPKRDRTSPTSGVSRFQNENVVAPSSVATSQKAPQEQEPSRLSRLLGRAPQPEQLALPTTNMAEGETISMGAPVEDFR